MDERQAPGCRRMILGTLVVIVAMVLCITTITLVVDKSCVDDMKARLPIYPNATIKLQQHNFLTQFGMGESVMVLHSDEKDDIVREWYSKTIGAVVYADVQKGIVKHMGRTNWTVGPDEAGTGSQIILYGYCGS